MMEHQLGAFTDCNHGAGLTVLHPVYYRHIYKDGLAKFKRFATEVWGIPEDGKEDEELALAGIEALRDFIAEIGLPPTLRELDIDETTVLKAIADSCVCVPGAYKVMTQEDIYPVLTAWGFTTDENRIPAVIFRQSAGRRTKATGISNYCNLTVV